ncbi:substrate-binding domain-containing protein [Muriventricola aceti]|uniref:substrate-binding domain-containing protein n=1 Tax=Muriventricola aceti TaxID=2981773 RepID=UPI0008221627|nr:substrate-binding domain-containing protein [Muriventricola aceti]MCU6701545.1 substrate-binding domain-containing protein [Muriventricola aceti]SCI64324.1 Phosphate-binding protein pstS precursor [uncultured Flavonifractor sp.]
MKVNWKELICRVFAAIFIGLFLGFLLAILLIYISLMAPTYVQRASWVLLPSLLAGAVLAILFPRRWRKGVALCLAAVTIGCGAYCAFGLWRSSVPTVDDRDLLLWQYEPFSEGTKAVSLEEQSTLRFHREDLLRLDGATALYPVYAGFVQAVYPQGEYPLYDNTSEGYGSVTCSGTVNAYERLITGRTDLIFAAAPSQEQLEMARRAAKELHLTPIGREAFVFFVNSRNPVEGLTVEQIQGIYTGQITNWNQVGGKNQPIRPFQRLENSGSQSALLRLMDGLPLIEPEKEDRVGGMGGIIQQVASYRNYKNSIGFSFRFYASEMAANDQIRLLALDGVFPTKESIRDGSYPISDSFFAITAAPIGAPDPRESNPKLNAFLDWILSEQGQQIVEDSGYVSIR